MPHKVFAALRGLLGGFSGAFLASLLWLRILPLGKLTLLLAWGLSPAACFGYWLLRGLKNRKFAYCSIYACVFSGVVLALLLRIPKSLPYALFLGVFAALMSRLNLGQVRLLRYTDPAWYAAPRRIAVARAGGALYNYHPASIPLPSGQLPPTFSVGGALEVQGLILRITPTLRKSRTFTVSDVAGVILGPSNGSNVLFDANQQVLAVFAWSQKNASLLAQLLREHGVHFYTCKEYGYSTGAAYRSDGC